MYTVESSVYGSVERPTMLEALEFSRVIEVQKTQDGMFKLADGCDGFHSALITQNQLLDWAQELIILANNWG